MNVYIFCFTRRACKLNAEHTALCMLLLRTSSLMLNNLLFCKFRLFLSFINKIQESGTKKKKHHRQLLFMKQDVHIFSWNDETLNLKKKK